MRLASASASPTGDGRRVGVPGHRRGEVDALCGVRLVRFATAAIFRRADLEQAGIEVVPTFRTPHVTLCHPVLEELVRRLIDCDHVLRANPYHVDE
jgi:hypothetical protein